MNTAHSKCNIHGILLLDKRSGISSNRALQEVKRLFNAKKAGHTGSLDPLATGLLPICFGEATKVSGMMLEDNKRYQAWIQLGTKTDTGDMEGEIIETKPVKEITRNEIETLLKRFTGVIYQVPPMHSALKHQGKKLYELARKGETVERLPRRITVFDLKLLNIQNNVLELEVLCSKGTYIRTLAEDIGEALGCGATLKALRRTQSGMFSIGEAKTFEQLQNLEAGQLREFLIDLDVPLRTLPSVLLNSQQSSFIKFGQILSVIEEPAEGSVRMYDEAGFLGLGEMRLDGKLAPKKLFNLNG